MRKTALPCFLVLLMVASLVGAPAEAQSNQKFEFVFPFEAPLPLDPPPDLFLVEFETPPYLWPTPWPSFDFRRPSGFVPRACRTVLDSRDGAVLDCWLRHHPVIAGSIVWEFERYNNSRWQDWSDEHKQDLREAFVAAREWKAAGFAGPWPGNFFVEPAANQEIPYLEPGETTTVLTFQAAWDRYLAGVAISLASEIDAWVPWSLRDYDAEMLDELFNAPFRQYTLDRDDGGGADSVFPGYVVKTITPAHGATIYRFLLEQELIGDTPLDTIDRMLNWARDNMQHSFVVRYPDGTEWSRQTESETFWGYTGRATVWAMLQGRVARHPELGVLIPEPHHWTYGCAGTSRFLRAVLAVVNIPVQELLSRRTCGHSLAFFSGEGRYLSHSDDPYNQLFRTSDFSGEELLIGSDRWNELFPVGDTDTACENVGRRVLDLNVIRPSEALVATHCEDLQAGNEPADSLVLERFRGLYTVGQLEARDLWDRLDARADTSTSSECVAWRDGP